jgi:hypothetical protein
MECREARTPRSIEPARHSHRASACCANLFLKRPLSFRIRRRYRSCVTGNQVTIAGIDIVSMLFPDCYRFTVIGPFIPRHEKTKTGEFRDCMARRRKQLM